MEENWVPRWWVSCDMTSSGQRMTMMGEPGRSGSLVRRVACPVSLGRFPPEGDVFSSVPTSPPMNICGSPLLRKVFLAMLFGA